MIRKEKVTMRLRKEKVKGCEEEKGGGCNVMLGNERRLWGLVRE